MWSVFEGQDAQLPGTVARIGYPPAFEGLPVMAVRVYLGGAALLVWVGFEFFLGVPGSAA